jgi:hypothetical protein
MVPKKDLLLQHGSQKRNSSFNMVPQRMNSSFNIIPKNELSIHYGSQEGTLASTRFQKKKLFVQHGSPKIELFVQYDSQE